LFRFTITGAPKRPPLAIVDVHWTAYRQADVIAIIRARCADILTDAEIAMVVRLAIEGPAKPAPKGQTKAKVLKALN
jgi:hypothetical protein